MKERRRIWAFPRVHSEMCERPREIVNIVGKSGANAKVGEGRRKAIEGMIELGGEEEICEGEREFVYWVIEFYAKCEGE